MLGTGRFGATSFYYIAVSLKSYLDAVVANQLPEVD